MSVGGEVVKGTPCNHACYLFEQGRASPYASVPSFGYKAVLLLPLTTGKCMSGSVQIPIHHGRLAMLLTSPWDRAHTKLCVQLSFGCHTPILRHDIRIAHRLRQCNIFVILNGCTHLFLLLARFLVNDSAKRAGTHCTPTNTKRCRSRKFEF
jgi:hypothetical protein